MKKNPKQIAAIICIAILVLMYLALLVFAIFDFPGSKTLFRTCLYATVTVPLLTWIYIYQYGVMKNRHTIASLDIGKTPEEVEQEKINAVQTQNEDSETITIHK